MSSNSTVMSATWILTLGEVSGPGLLTEPNFWDKDADMGMETGGDTTVHASILATAGT